MGEKSTHTASAADGICLQALHGTAHMHPERHSKGMKEQALNRATSCRRLKGDYAFPDRRPKLGRQCCIARHFACLHSGSTRAAAGNPVLRITCSSQSASLHSQSDNETFDRARGKKQLGSCFRIPSINRSALHAEQCAACNALFALTTRAHPPPRTAPPEACGTANRWSGVVRGIKVVGKSHARALRRCFPAPHPFDLNVPEARS
jgi:hypothetical protein